MPLRRLQIRMSIARCTGIALHEPYMGELLERPRRRRRPTAALGARVKGLLSTARLIMHTQERAQRVPEFESGSWVAKNAPYTYPDENNCYLAAISATTGKVMVPSFHRPWLPGANNWGAAGLTSLRANGSSFPPPTQNADGSWGDVENLEGKPTRQLDSMWMDLDAPVRHWRGRMYKPLFAFLAVDMDGRINVDMAGNNSGSNARFTSLQGFGPWEMNLDPVLGASQSANGVKHRYPTPAGSVSHPRASYMLVDGGSLDLSPPGTGAPEYSSVDWDAFSTSAKFTYPFTQYRMTPSYGARYDNGDSAERTNHAMLFNPYFADTAPTTTPRTPNLALPLLDVFYLNYKVNGDPANYAKSLLAQAVTGLQQNYAAGTANGRWMVTPFSNDLDLPGARPWRTAAAVDYAQAVGAMPVGQVIDSPNVGAVGGNSDFSATWKSTVASALGGVDLNRKLTDYRTDPAQPYEAAISGKANGAGVNYAQALADRQALAKDIFDRLAAATGAKQPQEAFPAATSVAQYDALRRLAQIAVNIVDYIDLDDYITPFNWNPAFPDMTKVSDLQGGWVFGTEVPRLVINEVFSNWDNDPADPATMVDPATKAQIKYAAKDYKLGMWIELHNPLTIGDSNDASAPLSHNGGAPLVYQVPGGNLNDVYQLIVTKSPDATLTDANNVDGHLAASTQTYPIIGQLGDLNKGPFNGVVPYSTATVGSPPAAAGSKGSNPSFYVIGPKNVANLKTGAAATIPGNDSPAIPVSYEPLDASNNSAMMWTVPNATQQLAAPNIPSTVLLRRLICPHLAAGPTNPYVTVDYVVLNQGQVYDHRQYLPADQGQSKGTNDRKIAFGDEYSFGRNQPYAGEIPQYKKQTNPAVIAGQDTHTNNSFYKHNFDAPARKKQLLIGWCTWIALLSAPRK